MEGTASRNSTLTGQLKTTLRTASSQNSSASQAPITPTDPVLSFRSIETKLVGSFSVSFDSLFPNGSRERWQTDRHSRCVRSKKIDTIDRLEGWFRSRSAFDDRKQTPLKRQNTMRKIAMNACLDNLTLLRNATKFVFIDRAKHHNKPSEDQRYVAYR